MQLHLQAKYHYYCFALRKNECTCIAVRLSKRSVGIRIYIYQNRRELILQWMSVEDRMQHLGGWARMQHRSWRMGRMSWYSLYPR